MVDADAKKVGMSLSDYVRSLVFGKGKKPSPVPPQMTIGVDMAGGPDVSVERVVKRLRWVDEFSRIKDLPPDQKKVEMVKLQAGRSYPENFTKMSVDERYAWLDTNWPLVSYE